MSYKPKALDYSDRECEMESIQRQIKELKIEMRGRSQRRNPQESSHRQNSTSGHIEGLSHQGHYQLSRDRSNKSKGHSSPSPRRERREHLSATLDAMSQALRRVARSPFFEDIERTKMPRHFTRLPFIYYYGKTNPVEHVSHFTQLMALYSWNDGLLWSSNLGPTAIR